MSGSTKTLAQEVSWDASKGCILRVVEGPDQGTSFELTAGSCLVGKASPCDLRLTDPAVSSQHLRVELSGDAVQVTDLESTNGTFYMGARVRDVLVAPGGTLTLGETKLSILASETAGVEHADVERYGSLLGRSAPMRRLYAQLQRLESVEYGVLIIGESGVGKELVAREIAKHSSRADGPYEVCDCTALPRDLAESELFGHVKGAFTGAHQDHTGVFERAQGGTVFLDEIGELPIELQPKLLRSLEAREIRPVGAESVRSIDARVVAATNRELTEEMKAGTFRQDLFFRLSVVTLKIPPLRDRREDIPVLVRHFLEAEGRDAFEVSPDVMELFASGYDWPGNVRELRNAIRTTVALGTVPQHIDGSDGAMEGDIHADMSLSFREAKKKIVDAFERDYLANQLDTAEENISQAARNSGVERNYFKQLLRKHDLLKRK